ncbi:MAG: Asp-tRNA(Asn)/Glu-tRNA(Gln) amidotransferase subunit GatC [Bacteroidota bacterium]
MEVTNEMIDKLAKLSRLSTDESNRDSLRKDLQQMISFVEKLQEVDTSGIEPLQHMSFEINKLREDKVNPSLSREEGLSNAAEKDEHFFLVPKAINKQGKTDS